MWSHVTFQPLNVILSLFKETEKSSIHVNQEALT
jgi:hypothetical protein